MRRILMWWLLIGCCAGAFPLQAATGRVVKVLPQYVDVKGRVSLSPSLYDRDAYQAVLRQKPDQRSGIRFEVQWKTKGGVWQQLKLKLELRGTAPGRLPSHYVFEQPVSPGSRWFSHWTSFKLDGKEYLDFGEVTAWRATLWEGEELLGEQKSFLW